MKKETFDKYTRFLQDCATYGTICDIKGVARKHKVSDAFISWLKLHGYLLKMVGGSCILSNYSLGVTHIVRAYNRRFDKKAMSITNLVKKSEPKPYATGGVITSKEEVFDSGKVARELSKKADEMQSVINKSLKQHEAEVIKLLKEIESDHGVSYSLTRTETTKTKLL